MPKLGLSNFYISSGIFTILSLFGAVFNYLTYPVLTRILDTSSFGNFTVTLALSNQIMAILLAFNVVSIYLVKNNSEEKAREKAQVVQKVLVWFFVAATFLVLILSPLIKTALKIDEPMTFLILAFMLLTAVPAVIWTGYLQGHKRLAQVGVYAFTGAFLKFVLAIAFGAMWGVVGALWGVLAGTILGLFTLWLVAGIKLPKIASVFTPLATKEKIFLKSLILYTLGAMAIVGGLGILQNIDIIFAKALFDKHTAGVYSGVSILSNAVYYVAFLLVWIILPEINPKNMQINHRVLASAYKLLVLMAAAALLVETMFKDIITQKLLGQDFAGQGLILISATLFQVSLVAVTLYAFYLLILRSYRSLMLGISVMIPCLTFPFIFGNTPSSMILSLLAAVWVGVAIYLIISLIFPKSRFNEQATS